MGLLQRFESRLEEVVSGAFAKAFRSAVQPVELAAALQREVDSSAQILSRDRRLVPNEFHVELSPTDYERLGPFEETLAAELVGMLREHADEQHYVFAGGVSIAFHEEDDLGTGRFRVRSHASAKVSTPREQPGGLVAALTRRKSPQAVVEVNGVRHPLVAPGLVIGRGQEADLRINDPGVSRRHAEIRVSGGKGAPTISIADLGSTNGTMVNGRRVDQAELTDGATIRVGSSTMTVHFVTGDSDGGEDVV